MANPQVPGTVTTLANIAALLHDLGAGGATPYATAGGAAASMAAGVVALETAVGTYAGGADIATDLAAVVAEVGTYVGVGAEASVAAGVVQAETDITALQATTPVIVSKAITAAAVAALGAAVSGSIDFDAALPAGAVVIGGGLNVTAVFDNAGDTASGTADLGIKSGDTDAFCDGASLDAIAKVGSPGGVGLGTLVGAVTPSVLVTFDVNCDTITKGAATAYLIYVLAF